MAPSVRRRAVVAGLALSCAMARPFIPVMARESEILSEKEFAEAYASYARTQHPDTNFEIADPLQIKFESKDLEYTINLDNLYSEYKRDPSTMATSIAEHLKSVMSYPQKQTQTGSSQKQTQTSIVPLIRTKEFVDGANMQVTKPGNRVLSEKFLDEIYIIYAINDTDTIQYLTEDALTELKMDMRTLKSVAVQNLERFVSPFTLTKLDGFSVIEEGGNFVSCYILLEKFWEDPRFTFSGDLVAFVISRDFIVLTGSGETSGLRNAEKFVREVFEQISYPISRRALVRRGRHWQWLET